MSRKLVNRGTEVFWCIACLSVKTGISEKTLRMKAEQYREMGCTLFL